MKHALIIALLFISCKNPSNSQEQKSPNQTEHQLLGSCEGCEGVFEYGDKLLNNVDTLSAFREYPNERIKISGTIFHRNENKPAANVILYIYSANPSGIYPKKDDAKGWAKRHGYNRGWIKTDESGSYTFYTARPGSHNDNPIHIHPIVLEPDGRYYWIDSYHFKSDPLLSKTSGNNDRGGNGIVEAQSREGSIPTFRRDIILGKNIPDY